MYIWKDNPLENILYSLKKIKNTEKETPTMHQISEGYFKIP